VLDNIYFWVLDTTPGSEDKYKEPWQSCLNLRVLVGPNLGGGGNAGHMLKIFKDACNTSTVPPTEVLILDDDLSLSPETLARYFMFCAYRAQEFICSLPVLMKSRPTVLWEDGGFWGRLNFHEGGGFNGKRNLFPNLLKHGWNLDGYDQLDKFTPLNKCEYSTFIFFGFSMNTFLNLGFPAPFFLRGDDIELSLRAQKMGVQIITNSNLAAWHEPAHSYGQEYMAILHGVIINLTYSEHGADFYTRYFEERLFEHASIDDSFGIKLYREILVELINPKSAILTAEFQSHYLAKLKDFSSIKVTKISEVDRVFFEQKAIEKNFLLLPFVYPGYQNEAKNFRSVVLINHSDRAYREIQPLKPVEKALQLREYADLIKRFAESFDAIRAHWQNKLKNSSVEAFWQMVHDSYSDSTHEIFLAHKISISESAVSQLSSSSMQEIGSVRNLNLHKSLRTETVKSTSADVKSYNVENSLFDFEDDKLPADFDPEMYLHINSDVKDSNFDPELHYIKHGRREGRRYRV
jgi:GT2 family glycosyltransferase